jgi:ribosomal protein S18 acetylase RimI-like enzyme
MHVLPEYQRRGIGQELFDKACEEANSNCFKYLVAETTNIQEAACNFYEKNSFEIESENLATGFNQNFKEIRYKRKL